MKQITFWLLLALSTTAVVFTSCKDDEEEPTTTTTTTDTGGGGTTVTVTGVSLNSTTLSLLVDSTYTLTATVSPSNATDKTITWTSSDTTKATVANGKITAVAAGTVTITAKAGYKIVTCTVTISPAPIAVTGVSLDKTTLNLATGEKYTLTATVSPSNATDKTVTWTSSNPAIATIANGKITALAAGVVTITAKAGDKTVTCTVTITANSNTQINADGKTGTVTDAQGNSYAIIKIGDQWWMTENLKATTYNDGTAIPNVTSATAWAALTTGAYCDYNNSTANGTKYGYLYNWYAVNTGKLAPAGWHVPTNTEWTTLENYLIANGYNYDGTTTGNKIAKSLAAKTNWNTSTTTGAIGNDLTLNNSTGFSALPGGVRDNDGSFDDLGGGGYWWSASERSSAGAWGRGLGYSYSSLGSYNYYKEVGFSVRCVRD